MNDFNIIKQYIYEIYQYYINKIPYKNIKQKENYLFNLKFNNKEKYIFLNLLFSFNINIKLPLFFYKITNLLNIDILFNKNKSIIYDDIIHQYLYQKIYNIFNYNIIHKDNLYNNKLSLINFKKKNNKYYFNDNILNYIKNLKNTPNNLLIACPIHDVLSCYFLNNKNKFCKWDYDIIKYNIKYLYNIYDIKIFYPYNININHNNYYLHSFIIVVNNEYVDTHFIYYKIDITNNDIFNIYKPDLLRYDTTKNRLNNEIINKLCENNFIKNEYNNIYNNKGIFDNLNYKVVFCYYRLVN